MAVTVTRTYLELAAPSDLSRENGSAPEGAEVRRRTPVAPSLFRELYRQVGEPYHWHDRNAWTDAQVAARFHGDRASIWELTVHGARAGFYELEHHDDGSVEIVLFGLLREFAGRGLGRWLLVDAVDRAWAAAARRVWLHTCTLDSPAALPNYLARGFRPFRTEEYEVAE
jgi:GNAT superfamily N-acetyltransferase